MARNDKDKPELARTAQDVEAPMHREPEGNIRFGRGGAANHTKRSEEEKRLAKSAHEKNSNELQRVKTGEDNRGLAEKGKDFLGKITGKK
ncbi:hypothetical protein EJ05DRAFT_475622 [Pseudovirgaria hyperparasitica]|uniref:Uncharacterized protein n=1 Tax=Pseudovirgaria hyperparasitica TaxID=470096 RepID=A0A6A6W966_9PEZI|nr:uncharacterized protein EJ05DRAFT_475622 [Pseudovirgaria hyperparasitica]KAF2759418.1 hypothetical protein EJ05DRAFT_475622 [Pseudovirgaria hyperparasitica]